MKKCNKIIYFLDFPFCVGGSNKVLLTQAYIMKQRGYQVKVVIPNDENGCHTEEYDRICDEYMLERLTAYYTIAVCMEEIDILAALDEYQDIAILLRDEGPDLVHSTQLNIAVELAVRQLGIPHLMNIYQADQQEFNVDWMKVFPQYHSADSYLMSNRWREGLGIASKCIRVAYAEKEKKSKVCKKNSEINILSIGGLCERKNQMECLKLISYCKESGYAVKLTILGDDKNVYGDKCKRYVEKNILQQHVDFAGFVSNVDEYFKTADLLVVASTVESYPGVIVESMANKVPIISTPVAGVPELLTNEKNGFLTNGYTAKNLYDAFSKYLEYRDSGKIAQLVENAYFTYLEQHTYERVGDKLDQYYHWIVNDYFCKDNSSCLTAIQVKQLLDSFIYKKKINISRIEKNKIWFIYHILPIIEKKSNKKVFIWGAGLWGKIVFGWLNLIKGQIEFAGFVDSYKQGEYQGFPIMGKENLLVDAHSTIIIVAVVDERSRIEIMDYLEEYGKERNNDYFLAWNGPIRL